MFYFHWFTCSCPVFPAHLLKRLSISHFILFLLCWRLIYHRCLGLFLGSLFGGFVINSFYYVEIYSLYIHFGKSFFLIFFLSWMDVEFFQWFFFSCICWDDHVVLNFSFANAVYDIDLNMLSHPCELGVNHTWLRYMIFFMWCWIQLDKVLLRIFATIFIKNIGL